MKVHLRTLIEAHHVISTVSDLALGYTCCIGYGDGFGFHGGSHSSGVASAASTTVLSITGRWIFSFDACLRGIVGHCCVVVVVVVVVVVLVVLIGMGCCEIGLLPPPSP